MKLTPEILLPGDILHVRGNSLFPSKAIRHMLGSWGNHDAIVVSFNGRLRIGETAPPWSRLLELDDYNRDIESGKIQVRVYRVPSATDVDRFRAGEWWIDHVQGRFYDFMAYPRLIAKCLIGDLWKKAAGWKWANWCTEGVFLAWACRGVTIWPTNNPTPLHTEKAAEAGRIKLVWSSEGPR